MRKKFLLPFLTFGAKAEKIQTVIGDLETGLLGHLSGHFFHVGELGVNYGAALGADHMGMRIGPFAVVTGAHIREAQLKHLIQLLQHRDGFVNRGQAGGGEFLFDLIVDHPHAGMVLALCQYLEHGQTLGRDAMSYLAQARYHLFQALVGFCQNDSLSKSGHKFAYQL
jgi:hypothetical protein